MSNIGRATEPNLAISIRKIPVFLTFPRSGELLGAPRRNLWAHDGPEWKIWRMKVYEVPYPGSAVFESLEEMGLERSPPHGENG
jgi:hypothetical protein